MFLLTQACWLGSERGVPMHLAEGNSDVTSGSLLLSPRKCHFCPAHQECHLGSWMEMAKEVFLRPMVSLGMGETRPIIQCLAKESGWNLYIHSLNGPELDSW